MLRIARRRSRRTRTTSAGAGWRGIARREPAAWSASRVWTTDARPIRSPHASGPSGQFVPSRIAVSIASGVATPSATAEAASLTIAARIRASICAGSSAVAADPRPDGSARTTAHRARHRSSSRSSRRSTCARGARTRRARAGAGAAGSVDRRRTDRRRVVLTAKLTSAPIASISSNGPIGKPIPRIASSTVSTPAPPSPTMRNASR